MVRKLLYFVVEKSLKTGGNINVLNLKLKYQVISPEFSIEKSESNILHNHFLKILWKEYTLAS